MISADPLRAAGSSRLGEDREPAAYLGTAKLAQGSLGSCHGERGQLSPARPILLNVIVVQEFITRGRAQEDLLLVNCNSTVESSTRLVQSSGMTLPGGCHLRSWKWQRSSSLTCSFAGCM